MLEKRVYSAFFFSVLFLIGEVSGTTFPRAQNVEWSSFNFKTILKWAPKPTDYSYTVEFSAVGTNRERNPHCIKSSETNCDLTSMLTDLKATYTADVISEPVQGETADLPEYPHTTSDKFCPYKDTNIGKPTFRIEVNKEKTNITLHIEDPPTAIYKDGRQLNIRDIFVNDLKYVVTYRKAKSTGKKTAETNTNQIALSVDKGESYCFVVMAKIPSRGQVKELGESSQTQCSPADDKPFYEVYGIGTIAGGILIFIAVLAVIITVIIVVCRRRRQRARYLGKDGVPLSSV